MAGNYFNQGMEASDIPNQEAKTIENKSVNKPFVVFPLQNSYTQIRKKFQSDLLEKKIGKLLHVEKRRTTSYHSQCDGLIEQFNQTLLSMIATSITEHLFDWEK